MRSRREGELFSLGDLSTPSTSLEDQFVHVTQPEDQTAHATQPEDQSTHVTQPEDQSTHVTQPEDQVVQVTQPEDQTTHVTQPEVQTAHVAQHEDQTAHVAQSEDQTAHVAQPEDQLVHVTQPEDQTTHVIQPENRPVHVTQPEDQTVHVTQPEGQLAYVTQPEDQLALVLPPIHVTQPEDQLAQVLPLIHVTQPEDQPSHVTQPAHVLPPIYVTPPEDDGTPDGNQPSQVAQQPETSAGNQPVLVPIRDEDEVTSGEVPTQHGDQPVQVTFRGISLARGSEEDKEKPVISPRCRLYRNWDVLTTLSIFLTCLLTPFQACFNSNIISLWILAYVLDALFLLDVLLRFHVGYFHKGSLITDKKKIRTRYLRGAFAPDLLTLLPLDLFVFVVTSNSRWHQTLSLLRLNRILRVFRLFSFFATRENELGSKTSLIRAFKYMAIGSIMVHCLSCVWFALGCPNEGAADQSCYEDRWAIQLGIGMQFASTAQRYALSLYWATATATSTGYGDIHATTLVENWFSVVAMLVGVALFFGLILGGMASMLTNLDSQRSHYIHHLNVIRDHMKDMEISADIQNRVLAYYEYLWTHNHGVNGVGMFDNLPLTFQAELSLSVNRKVLDKAPLFQGLNPGFKRMLSLVIKPIFYMPNQIIANRGDIGHHMFYIHKGKAEILSEDDKEVLVVLDEEKLFGEVSMVYNLPRSASVRAATPCVIFLLDRADLNRVLKHYPDVAEKLYMAVETRCDLDQAPTATGEKAGKETILNIEQDQAEVWVRENVYSREAGRVSVQSYLKRITSHVILPDSWLAVIWGRILLAVMLAVCLVYSFVASFSVSLHLIGYGESTSSLVLFVVTYAWDLVFILDFFMRFNKATPTTSNLRDIRKQYIGSVLFFVDLLAILPLEIFAFVSENEHERWHSVAFFRLNRLIKVVRISTFFSSMENSLDYSIGKVRALKFSIYITLITHFSACVWFFEACYGKNCAEEGWAQHVNVANGTAGLKEYIASMYWAAATMSSTGYGDIHAHDTNSQLISVVVMLIGLLLYGYCLSSIAATLANSAAPKVEFVGKMSAVKEFMTGHNLSLGLTERVDQYLSILWKVYRGEAVPGGTRLLEDMPLSLQQDVCFEETKGYLEKVPIFMETDPGFLRLLSLKTTSYLFTPGDYIVYAGDMGREMYCVRRGLVQVIGDDEVTVVATLGPGGYFGEVGLIFGESRLATVRAKTYCEILMLTKPDLDEVLAAFPIVARQISDAGVNDNHLKEVRKAAFEASRKAVRRLSVQCSQKNKASKESRKSQREKSKEFFKKMQHLLPEENEDFEVDQKFLDEEFKRPFSELSLVTRPFSWLLMRKAIMPNSRFLLIWQGISVAISGIMPVTLSLQAAFLHTSTALWVVNYLFDLFYLVDMYIKCHVAFYNNKDVLVTHPLFTARNYLRTNFSLDLLASFPTDVIVLAVWPKHLGILRILSLARLNRSIHLYKLNQFFGYMEEPIGKQTNIVRQLKFAAYMAIFTHCIACGWFMAACKGLEDGSHVCTEGSWADKMEEPLSHESVAVKYVTCLYWAAATSASVGYGDVHAHLVPEMAFALICMITGIVFYGYIIAGVAASLANADAKRARYQERLTDIENFLEDQEINENLSGRIRSYYEYLWIRNDGVDPSSLFEGLPLSLQADITLSLYKDMIERVPLFEGTEIGFLKMLSMNVRPVYFLAKEYIVRKGDIGQEMYFIHRGMVDVVSEHEEPIVFDTMNEGRFFGEISIVFSCPRTASIRAQTNCDLFVLTKQDLDEVLTHYPQIRTKILETAEERQRMVKERAAAFAAKKKQEEEDKKRQEEEDRLAKEAEDIKRQEEGKVDGDGDDDQNKASADDGKAKEGEAQKNNDVAITVEDTDSDRVTCPGKCKASLGSMFISFVIKSDSKLNYIKFVSCILICVSSMTITYMAALQDHPLFMIVFNYVCELFFYIEIFFNFHMSYISDIGDIITDHKKLAVHYAKGEFPFDLVASFPIDIFALAAPAGMKLKTLSYLRMLHLLRLVRMQQFFTNIGKRLNIDVFKVRMSNFFLRVVLVVHFFACGWALASACTDEHCLDEDHADEIQNVIKQSDPMNQYGTAVYWAVASMTSTGYGDVHAETTIEKVYASLVMVIGKLLFGFILGNIASTLANAEIRRVKYEEKLGAIQAHMEDQHIPTTLQERVMNFYEFIWNKNKGRDHRGLFYDMPQCMNGELCMAMISDVISKIPLFEGTEEAFIRLLCTKVKPAHFHAGEYMVRRGDIDEKMYIIRRGTVEVVTDEDPPEVMETLEEGVYFGEKNLILTTPREESFRAVTHVDVLVLTKEDVDSVLSCYEEVSAHVQSVAKNLYPEMATAKSK